MTGTEEAIYLLGTGVGASATSAFIAALLEDITETARQLAAANSGGRLEPPLALVLDEIANLCAGPLAFHRDLDLALRRLREWTSRLGCSRTEHRPEPYDWTFVAPLALSHNGKPAITESCSLMAFLG
ncbi:hypothetical protein EV652_12188 [Kribbella steppae]|uniref:Uncharacterized protein n=1 Tax=Kribbella steppae TaxID=2512223 RepID=A0A4R2GXK1_9ACTN|nr:hypothetical protein [Kribbella steppae]TCO15715.1 hypothetical protein EV652_12188 [Kribbella steppae]